MNGPNSIVVYRSQGEKMMDDFLYGGGMFEEGFITSSIFLDIVLILVVVAVVMVASAYLPKIRGRRYGR